MKKPTSTDRAALVDELGALDAQIAPLEDLAKRAAEIRAKVRALYADESADQTFTTEGKKYLCTVGVCGNERRITSMPQVFASLGASKFMAACSFTLKKLDELLAPAEVALLVASARTGTRPVKTFAKAKAKAAA